MISAKTNKRAGLAVGLAAGALLAACGGGSGKQESPMTGQWKYRTTSSYAELELDSDDTFRLNSIINVDRLYGYYYSYNGRFEVSGDKIVFRDVTVSVLENDLALFGQPQLLRESGSTHPEATISRIKSRAYTFAIKIINGQRTAVFRQVGGPQADDLLGLAPPSDKKDEDLTFSEDAVFKKVHDVIDNVVVVNDTISEDETWTGDKVYRLCPSIRTGQLVDVSATVTLEPGTRVEAVNGSGLAVLLNGAIIAKGTRDQPIVFQASDGASDNPTSKDRWHGLSITSFFSGGGRIDLSHCKISGGQIGLRAEMGGVRVEDCTFEGNLVGLDVHEIDPSGLDALSFTAERNVFYGNKLPVAISSTVSFSGSNVFHNPELPGDPYPNTYNGIFVALYYFTSYPSIDKPVTWSNTEVAYVICKSSYCGADLGFAYTGFIASGFDTSDGLRISSRGSLTLAQGTALKFGDEGTNPACPDCVGKLTLYVGEPGALKGWEGATFTAYRDDATKGDTDHDGGANPASPASWMGIQDSSTGAWYRGANILYSLYSTPGP